MIHIRYSVAQQKFLAEGLALVRLGKGYVYHHVGTDPERYGYMGKCATLREAIDWLDTLRPE